jgi:hypothetical protein
MARGTVRSLADEIRNMPDEELAAWRANATPDNLRAILAREEQERRARLHQHELDLDLVARQVHWMKFTAILSAVMTVIGRSLERF